MLSPALLRDPQAVIDVFDRAAETLRASPFRAHALVRLPARGRLLASGDLHDNPAHLRKIIALARLDESYDHHLVLHEIIHGERLINGMDFSHRMLATVAALVIDYPTQAHPLLANHELAQMTGRSISKGAGDAVKMFNEALDFAYGEEGVEVGDAIGRFIAAMPLALQSEAAGNGEATDGGGVFCAHSLPAPAMMKKFDLGLLQRAITDDDLRPGGGSAHALVWGRGHTPEQVETLAQAWGVKLFVLGHERVEMGIDAKGPRLIVLNSDHEHGTALPIDLARVPLADEALLHAIPLAAVSD